MVPVLDKLLERFHKPKKHKARSDSETKREKLMDKTVAIAIATDPEVERQWIEKKYGIYYPKNDPIAMVADELRKKWSAQSLQILGEDEKSQEFAIQALVKEIKKNKGRSERLHGEADIDFDAADQEEEINPKLTKRKLRREMIEHLRDSGNTDRPAAKDNIDPAKHIFSKPAKRDSTTGIDGGTIRTIAVEIDGTLVEMSQEAYQIYKKQREELLAARARSKDLHEKATNNQLPHSK